MILICGDTYSYVYHDVGFVPYPPSNKTCTTYNLHTYVYNYMPFTKYVHVAICRIASRLFKLKRKISRIELFHVLRGKFSRVITDCLQHLLRK